VSTIYPSLGEFYNSSNLPLFFNWSFISYSLYSFALKLVVTNAAGRHTSRNTQVDMDLHKLKHDPLTNAHNFMCMMSRHTDQRLITSPDDIHDAKLTPEKEIHRRWQADAITQHMFQLAKHRSARNTSVKCQPQQTMHVPRTLLARTAKVLSLTR